MKIRGFVLLLFSQVWIVLILSPLGSAQTELRSAPTSASGSLRNTVVEMPMGPIDGRNPSFTLSSLPISCADVSITVNGAEIKQGSLLSVQDRTLTFYSLAIPKRGDVIQAIYATQIPVSIRTSSDTASLVNHTLMRMVDTEEVQTRVPHLTMPRSRSSEPGITPTYRESSPRSLLMLRRRLEEAGSSKVVAVDAAGEEELRSLMGFEGTGDISANPYKQLFGSYGNGRRTAKPTRYESAPFTTKDGRLPRSLAMLRTALSQEIK